MQSEIFENIENINFFHFLYIQFQECLFPGLIGSDGKQLNPDF